MNKLLKIGLVGGGILAIISVAKAHTTGIDSACQEYITNEGIDMNSVTDDQELRLYNDYQAGRLTFDCAKEITTAYQRTHP